MYALSTYLTFCIYKSVYLQIKLGWFTVPYSKSLRLIIPPPNKKKYHISHYIWAHAINTLDINTNTPKVDKKGNIMAKKLIKQHAGIDKINTELLTGKEN